MTTASDEEGDDDDDDEEEYEEVINSNIKRHYRTDRLQFTFSPLPKVVKGDCKLPVML